MPLSLSIYHRPNGLMMVAACCLLLFYCLVLTRDESVSLTLFPSTWSTSSRPWNPSSSGSGWFVQGGYMRLDAKNPFASYYTLTSPVTAPFPQSLQCDKARSLGSTVLCLNTNSLVSSLAQYERALVGSEHPAADEHRDGSAEDLARVTVRSPVLTDLAGKRALILGDSVERHMLYYLRDQVIKDRKYFSGCHMDDSRVLQAFDGAQGVPRMMVIPISPSSLADSETFEFARDVDANQWRSQSAELESSGSRLEADDRARSQLRIDFLHMYGTDDDDLWEDRESHQGVTAWRSRDRLAKAKDMWGAHPNTYDVVFVNFGLWELARYQRTAYILRSTDDELGLPQEWLEDYKGRMRTYVELIQTTWPGAKVVIKTIHDARDNAGGWFRSANMKAGGFRQAPFTKLRTVQLRRAQLQVASELKVEAMNWGDLMVGQDESWLSDDIHPAASGSLVLAEMYLRIMAHL